ncbi:hypothetical protein ACP70R_032399 [Stipagrostis hirtigluma subsp. patula]
MDLIDHILRLILGRLDSPIWLIRAACTCKQWHRIIADAGFLRRFHSVYTVVAGDYFNDSALLCSLMGVGPRVRDRPSFVPAPPSSSIDDRRFFLDFLPDDAGFPHCWTVVDSRGSLLLMNRTALRRPPSYGFPDLFVCEPAARTYKRIPPPPDFRGRGRCCYYMESYLVDGDGDMMGRRIGMSNFRVLCMFKKFSMAHMRTALFTVMFTAGGVSTGSSWSDDAQRLTVGSQANDHPIDPNLGFGMRHLGRAGGSWYFYIVGRKLIALDGGTGEFSYSVLPPPSEINWGDLDEHMWNNNFYVADGRDGEPRIFTVLSDTMKVFARLGGDGEWALEKSVELSKAAGGLPGYKQSFFDDDMTMNILTRGPGYVVLSPKTVERWLISVDLETMEVAPVAEDMGLLVYRCEFPWPPALNAS